MGCQQSVLASQPVKSTGKKKAKESDDAIQGSPREVEPANRPKSAENGSCGTGHTDSKSSAFSLFKGGKTKTESKTPPKRPPPQRLKSALRSPSRNDMEGPAKEKRSVVFVLGGPGCGKGTQCERIVKQFGFLHLSAGDLLREEVRKATPIGQKCDKLMKEGKLVPVEITLGLIEKAMNESNKSRFLIDGYPRAIDQAKAFESKICRPDKVLFLECPKEVMQERLLKRGESSGRSDDNQATIIKRFETFEKESLPVIGYYENLDKNIVAKVSSVPAPDQVYKTIEEQLKKIPKLQVAAEGGVRKELMHDFKSKTFL